MTPITRKDTTGGKFFAAIPDPEGSPRGGLPYRIRVSYDPEESGLVEIADEQYTSLSARAFPVDGGRGLDLTIKHARWLHEQLGKMIAMFDAGELRE